MKNFKTTKRIVKELAPPVLVRMGRALRNRFLQQDLPEWEYVAKTWSEAESKRPARGWNQESVRDAYQQQWKELQAHVSDGTFFHGDSHKHSTLLVFAYSLALAAQRKDGISLLDWGGNFGAYNLFSRAFLPNVRIEYHCKDVPVLTQVGQQLHPDAHFHTDESCLSRQYDFVLVSGSLQYSSDWSNALKLLAGATLGHLLVTRSCIVERGASYVCLQRAYDTECIGWCINREELLESLVGTGLHLLHEFQLSDAPIVPVGAPEGFHIRGFLFRRRAGPD
jgi:putative methyltransferase (TIGR04325 family)